MHRAQADGSRKQRDRAEDPGCSQDQQEGKLSNFLFSSVSRMKSEGGKKWSNLSFATQLEERVAERRNKHST